MNLDLTAVLVWKTRPTDAVPRPFAELKPAVVAVAPCGTAGGDSGDDASGTTVSDCEGASVGCAWAEGGGD
jgi:hypothetical protein